jgi:hypothetical protein
MGRVARGMTGKVHNLCISSLEQELDIVGPDKP